MTDLIAVPSTSRFVEANGVKLHYLDYGTAGCPPMVLFLASPHASAITGQSIAIDGGSTPGIRY